MKKIRRVFIANRGEIARRIAKSAKKLNIETLAICEKNRRPGYLSPWIDHWHEVDKETRELYLNAGELLKIAKKYSCDAIHPGFGFLSENAEFARSVEASGLSWIGPSANAIEAMASKAQARETAEKLGLPCIPGNQIPKDMDADLAAKQAQSFVEKFGLPVLIKAALGGGGKGMRVVKDLSEISEQIQRARSEALSSFGDESLVIERYLDSPRHIEVQVLADTHANVVTLGDRDCSLQRRHQKIIEEAPAPNLDAQLRSDMHEAAKTLASHVGYVSAGTVEFLVDENEEGKQRFYFLEMNTRLQVEHPVTEEIFATDLVAWQFEIANLQSIAGQNFQAIPGRCSIEARLYAEDPYENFFPAPGPVYSFKPAYSEGVRWEIGLDAMDEISSSFDPMIAKLVVSASSRAAALEKLAETLNKSIFSGPPANLEFLAYMSRHPEFQSGKLSTFFLDQNLDPLIDELKAKKNYYQKKFDTVLDELYRRLSIDDASSSQLLRRCFTNESVELDFRIDFRMRYSKQLGCYVTSGNLSFFCEGQLHELVWVLRQTPKLDQLVIKYNGFELTKEYVPLAHAAASSKNTDSGQILSPVPGKVVSIECELDQLVEANQRLLVLESMKMEFEVKTPVAGRVVAIHIQAQEQSGADQLLVEIESDQKDR